MSAAFSSNHASRATVVDLFSGAGGTGYGFQDAGFDIRGAVEKEKNAATTYRNNLGVKVEEVDIRDLDPCEFRAQLALKTGELDVLVGCPPCQGFTRLRNKDGAGDRRNDLVLRYIDFVEEFLPRFAVFENVPGLVRTAHGRKFYRRLTDGLEELGYRVVKHEVDAADYGVPQHRVRIIVVAGRDGEVPPFPKKTHGAPHSEKVAAGELMEWITVEDRIGPAKLPSLAAGENGELDGQYPNHIAPSTGERVLGFIKHVPKNGGSRRDVDEKYWLECHRNHDGHNDVYGRLAWAQPAGTITTGCTNPSKGRFVHPEQDRAITAHEAAILQSFPPDYRFFGYRVSEQIGNAVPPLLAKAIASALLDRLSGDKRE